MAKIPRELPHLLESEDEKRKHIALVSCSYNYFPGIIDIANEHPESLTFETAIYAATGLVASGDEDRAWSILESKFPEWRPVDWVQVAPVAMLTEIGIRKLMTPERCLEVLSTPLMRE